MPMGARAEGLLDKLKSALDKYCVPNGNVISAEEVCSEYSLAKFDTVKGRCRCPCEDQWYDKESRSCKDCDTGSLDLWSTECKASACGDGYYAVDPLPDGGTCPNGYYAVDYVRSCPGVDGSPVDATSCPDGFYRPA
jgi:hypothetical protein